MQKSLKLMQALVRQPGELDRALSVDDSADKMSLADTLITLTRASSVDAVSEAAAHNKIRRLKRRD